jgi:phosphoribosylaminoimidazole-succinocarboxamide synthase
LIDEVMTPDSSRFWALDSYRPGSTPPSFDKQPLRDYLERERQAGRWNGDAPAPPLPADVVAATSARYLDAFRRITGRSLDEVLSA